MSDLALSVRLTADGSGLVGQLKLSKEETDRLKGSLSSAATESRELATAGAAAATASRQVAAAAQAERAALAATAQAARQKQIAMAGLGQQIGDVTQGLALGINPAVVFGQQIGQIAFSAQGLGGKLGAVATFLSGPWGAAITGAVVVLGLMAESFLSNENAADKSKNTTDLHRLSLDELTEAVRENDDALKKRLQTSQQDEQAQRALAGTALKRALETKQETKALIEQAIAVAQIARERAAGGGEDKPVVNALDKRVNSLKEQLAGLTAGIPELEERYRRSTIPTAQREVLESLNASARATGDYERALTRLNEQRTKGALSEARYREELSKAQVARDKALDAARKADRQGEAAVTRQTGRQISGGEADRILAGIGATVTSGARTPERNRAVGGSPNSFHLTDQARDLAKTPGLTLGRIRSAFEEAGVSIKELLDEGDHFHVAWGRATDTARVAAQAARDLQQEQAELARELGVVTQAFDPAATAAAAYAEQLARIDRLEKTGKLDPGAARDFRLEAGFAYDEKVAAADQARLKALVDRFGPEWKAAIEAPLKTGGALDELEIAAERFGKTFRESGLEAARDIADLIGSQLGAIAGDAISLLTGDIGGLGQSRAGRVLGSVLTPPQGIVTDPFGQGLEEVFAPIRDGLGDLIGRLTGIFGEQGSFTKALGRAAANATLGGVIGPGVGGLLGGKQSSLGGSIGGVVGGELGKSLGPAIAKSIGGELGKSLGAAAGPIGAIAGSILGSVVGGALKTSKRGSATITGTESEISTRGNSGQFKAAASGSARTVQDALRAISEQLGGGLGDFAVSIGVRDGKFRVDQAGQGRTKTKAGAVDFGEDERAAISFAIADAIADGAVTGLSDAVQRALRSSSDVDKALREALKVDELETLLKGTGGELEKAFRDFERQAAERRRIATQYGFDVVELEKRTAADRLKLFEDTVKSRVGALQDVLDDLDFGDLFEGSIADQRQKLLVEVTKAEDAARAGTAGAADRVADLRRQLLEVSKEGFGTFGGELAADRASTRSAAEEIIRLENERTKKLQDAAIGTKVGIDENNKLTNETNDLLARMAADMGALRAALTASGAGSGGGIGLGPSTARQVQF